MGQLTVRNLDDDVIAALKARAKHAGRSAEAEHRRILEETLRPRSKAAEDFIESVRELRVKVPPGSPRSEDLIRKDRDRDDLDFGDR